MSVLVPGNLLGLHLRRSLALQPHSPGHASIRFVTLVDLARSYCLEHLLKEGIIEPPPLIAQLLFEEIAATEISGDGYFSKLERQGELEPSLWSAVTDLKEACIGAHELENWAATASLAHETQEKLSELALIYHAYERRMKELGYVERNDLLDRAIPLIAPSEETSLFIYGFYDFNPLQKRFIAKLIETHQVLAFFPWQDAPAYEYALPCLNWLKSQGCEHILLDAEEARPLQKVAYSLFGPSRELNDVQAIKPSIAVITAPGEAREIHEVIREALRWVESEGMAFSDIAILLRSSEPYAPIVIEALTRLGIPYYLNGGTALAKTRAGQSLNLLLAILEQNYSRTSVMEFISYAPIAFDVFGDVALQDDIASWDYFAIAAGIVAGKEEWRDRLERLHRRIVDEPRQRNDSDEIGHTFDLRSVERFQQFLQRLFDSLAKIPKRGSWSTLAQPISDLFRKILLSTAETQRVTDEIEALAKLDLLGEETSLEQFVRAANIALTSARHASDGFGKGGIFVGDLMSARGLTFKAVIVPGMVEKFFPHVWRQDPILLDQERQYMSEGVGKELSQKSRQYEEERLLFAFTLMAAREKILFSTPRIELLTARERIPSFFLLRLMEAATGRPASFADFEAWELVRRVPLTRLFPKTAEEALDEIEYDLGRADALISGTAPSALDYLSTLGPFFDAALAAEAARWGKRRFTPYDGWLHTGKTRAHLKRLYHCRRLSLSPTALEGYARCPYRFFLERLLGLAPLEEPDPFAWVPALDRGALIHKVLFRFIERLKVDKRLPLKKQDAESLEEELLQVAAMILDGYEKEQAAGFPLLWELDKEQMTADLREWLKAELNESDMFVPVALEEDFAHPFSLGADDMVSLTGRIDRIDIAEDGRLARVIDYKTGRPLRLKDGEFHGGEALQLPIYLLASEQILNGVSPLEADYYYVSRNGRYQKDRFTRKDWEIKLERLRSIIAGLISNLRRGLFIARPPSCGRCPYPWICTPAAEALYDRKRQDPRIAEFERLKEIP
jgi:ATP-dependent helicase/DNAse subunit B